VSHETIYKFAYSPDGHAIKLWQYLREHRPDTLPRHCDSYEVTKEQVPRETVTPAELTE
jgi:IS30 family transposase